jgi:hypothetical protein
MNEVGKEFGIQCFISYVTTFSSLFTIIHKHLYFAINKIIPTKRTTAPIATIR